ncbi:hypothetical protein FHU36_001713 [Nonomuraea muscovyensis]|uniref:Uncharacterized protein n=1 Tax=Nonomuraea muscovyensis TaxID=1124761 RepID=A0A7X0BYF1_9ACTN|nr:hypothetical protein [Nonomuraea muscovyensis]MBB6345204.1 hypothetical protein [Nonomuraea muscovyensis]
MARSGAALRERRHGGAFREDAATRHLCAGVYLDPAFRRTVIRQVYNDTARMVAPSYGFDLIPVVRHAWRAWLLDTTQHLCVLAILVLNPPVAIVVVSTLCFLCLLRVMIRSALVVLPLRAKAIIDRLLHRPRWLSESDELRQNVRLLRLSGLGCAVLILTLPMVAGFAHVSLEQMTRSAAFLGLLLVVVVSGKAAIQQLSLNSMHWAEALRPPKLTLRQLAIDDQQFHPYVVYQRPSPPEPEEKPEHFTFKRIDEQQSPFVGSGQLVHRWLPPLTVQLLKSQPLGNGDGDDHGKHTPMEVLEYPKPPFKAHELVAHLKKAMAPMGDVEDPTGLRGFTVHDRLYIAEPDVEPSPEWLRKRPNQNQIDEMIDDPYDAVHHFLEIGATATGELVTTVFLRVTVKGRALSLDFAACALTRTPAEYQVLNAFAETGVSAVLRSVLRGLLNLPAEVARVWRLAEALQLLIGAMRARKNRMLKPRRGMAIAAQLSVREEKSTPWEHAQLDEVTIHDHMKLIEERLLKATEDFLESHEIDTSAFKKRATSIINMGVLNMGGKTEIKQSAVGANAQVRTDSREPDRGAEQSPTNEGGQR